MKLQSILRLTFLLVCFSWMVNIQVYATHIVGGEIYYEHQGGNEYLVTLIVYRDCGPDNINNTGFDTTAPIGVYAGSSVYNVFYLALSDGVVNSVPLTLDNPCFIPPLDLCIEEAIYQDVISLPPNANGYDIVYQRCCRNNSIINVQNADDSGISVFSHVPGGSEVEGNNSAPVYNNSPSVALCLGAEFFYDHSATDADGDELVYEFYAPFLGGGPDGGGTGFNSPSPDPPAPPNMINSVLLGAGYSNNYQIDSNPGFTIDPATGYITGTATTLGTFAIGVAVHEYREGVLFNSTYRDIQYIVTICDPTIIASQTVDEQLYCEGLTFEFINESVNGSSFYWDFGDPSAIDDNSTQENPTYTYPDAGIYDVMLIANPDWFCADTSFAEYEAVNAIEVAMDVSDFECINGEAVYSFESVGENTPTSQYSWDFGENATPQFSNDINPGEVVFEGDGELEVSLNVSDFECETTEEATINIAPAPVAAIGAQEEFCAGMTVSFTNNSVGAETYQWDFGDDQNVNPNSNLFEPTFAFSELGVYQVTLEVSAPFACPSTTTADFAVYPLMEAFFDPPGEDCFTGNSFDLDFGGAETNSTDFLWDFGSTVSNSSLENPQAIVYPEPGTFPITLIISNEYCEKVYTDSAYVYADPTIGLSIDNANGCEPLDVLFEDHSFSENTLYYLWEFGDGSQSTSANPRYIYENPGVYDVTLTAYTLSGCVVSLTETNSEAIVVHPKPVSNFYITPAEVNILEPHIEISDLSEGATSVGYYFGNDLISNDFEFHYSIYESGEHFITQEAISEFGCVAESTFGVIVSGNVIYVPNAFSPNDDGINDYFQIISSGISNFEMKVYNRWGTVIYQSKNVDDVWTGDVDEGQAYYGQNESYIYHITYQGQFSSDVKEIVGEILILR